VPIQENALNSALAQSLSALDLHATAEETQGNLSQSLRHPDTPSPRRSALHGGGVQDRAERGPAAGGGQGRPALAEPDRPLERGRALPLRGFGEDRPKTPRQRLDMAAACSNT